MSKQCPIEPCNTNQGLFYRGVQITKLQIPMSKVSQKKVIPQFRSQERTRDGTDRDAGENFRAVTLACPSNSRRSSSSVHDPIRSWWLANPHECQCSPHSKIFGSIPVGTTKFAPITEGLQKIFLLLTNSSIYGYL
jgi:hypothetical protein